MLGETADPETRARLQRMVELCPSGTLAWAPTRDADEVEPTLEPGVAVSNDGPILVRGGVPVVDRRRAVRVFPQPSDALPVRPFREQALLRRDTQGDRVHRPVTDTGIEMMHSRPMVVTALPLRRIDQGSIWGPTWPPARRTRSAGVGDPRRCPSATGRRRTAASTKGRPHGRWRSSELGRPRIPSAPCVGLKTNGPIRVSGDVAVSGPDGASVPAHEGRRSLCRCLTAMASTNWRWPRPPRASRYDRVDLTIINTTDCLHPDTDAHRRRSDIPITRGPVRSWTPVI